MTIVFVIVMIKFLRFDKMKDLSVHASLLIPPLNFCFLSNRGGEQHDC